MTAVANDEIQWIEEYPRGSGISSLQGPWLDLVETGMIIVRQPADRTSELSFRQRLRRSGWLAKLAARELCNGFLFVLAGPSFWGKILGRPGKQGAG